MQRKSNLISEKANASRPASNHSNRFQCSLCLVQLLAALEAESLASSSLSSLLSPGFPEHQARQEYQLHRYAILGRLGKSGRERIRSRIRRISDRRKIGLCSTLAITYRDGL